MSDSMNLTEEQRKSLAETVMHIFAEWRLEEAEMIALLGMPEGTKPRMLSRFKHGTPLPDDENMLERVRHILGIRESLGILNPLNPNAGFLWLRNKSKYFPQRPPIQVMIEDGFLGLKQVWTNLDCTQGWD